MRDFTREQWEAVWVWLGSPLRRIGRLRARLERMGARPDDEYYKVTCRAYDELHQLAVMAHYRSCETGVARPDPAARAAEASEDGSSEAH